jgi:hypothetical protein
MKYDSQDGDLFDFFPARSVGPSPQSNYFSEKRKMFGKPRKTVILSRIKRWVNVHPFTHDLSALGWTGAKGVMGDSCQPRRTFLVPFCGDSLLWSLKVGSYTDTLF